ncbi:MAG TPA: aromatic acid exporter family protein [Bacillus bacterium]|nr:aromatic acid exporter family protein [Bacillus sp. (in: firmicutes)]
MLKIGTRTLKTAIGTVLAISIAKFFDLDHYASAGILTILCIQATKKKSVKTAWARFVAALIGIVFSFIFFEGIGYYPIVIGIILIFFIPVAVRLKVQEGLITSSVIILQFFNSQDMSITSIANGIFILIIGIGVALLMNLYMPSAENKLFALQKELEAQYKKILNEMSIYLKEGDHLWDGREITESYHIIQMAKTLAVRHRDNRFLGVDDDFYKYFKMREKQFEVIERMLSLVTSIKISMLHSKIIADLIDEIADAVHSGNTAILFLEKLEGLHKTFKEMPLPQTREEFEIRASLLNFLWELEKYLNIKRYYRESDV